MKNGWKFHQIKADEKPVERVHQVSGQRRAEEIRSHFYGMGLPEVPFNAHSSHNPKPLNPSLCITLIAAALTASAPVIHADVTNIKDALAIAMEHEAVSTSGEKIKLYSLSAHYHGTKKRWNFQFFNTGENLHNVTVTSLGNALHYLRSKGDISVFKNLDFSQLPAPKEVLLGGLIEKGMSAITALKFKPASNSNLYIRYQLRNDLLKKDKACHVWSITIPIGDGKQAKTATFLNGQIDTVTNAIISGG